MKTLLFILLAFVSVTSTISGILLISHPDGKIMQLSLNLLSDSPFKDFLIPGICLAVLVGGTNLLALVYNIMRHPSRYNLAIAGGVMICGWIVVQVILISTFQWLQLIYFGTGILIILTADQLKGKWLA